MVQEEVECVVRGVMEIVAKDDEVMETAQRVVTQDHRSVHETAVVRVSPMTLGLVWTVLLFMSGLLTSVWHHYTYWQVAFVWPLCVVVPAIVFHVFLRDFLQRNSGKTMTVYKAGILVRDRGTNMVVYAYDSKILHVVATCPVEGWLAFFASPTARCVLVDGDNLGAYENAEEIAANLRCILCRITE